MAVMLFVLFLAGLHTLLASEQCVAGGPHCRAALSNESDADDLAPAVLLLQSGLRREEVGDAGRAHRRRRRSRRRRYDVQMRGNCALTMQTREAWFGGGLRPAIVDGCVNLPDPDASSSHVLVKEGCRVVMHGERGCRGEERELVSAVGESSPRVLLFSHLRDIGWGGGRLKALSCTCGGDRAASAEDHEDDDDHDDEEDHEEPVDEHEDDEDLAEEAQRGGDQAAEAGPDEEVQGLGDSADEAGGEDFAEEHAGDEAGDESSPEVPEVPETGLVRLEEGRGPFGWSGRRRRFHESYTYACTVNFYRDVHFLGRSWPAVLGEADKNFCQSIPYSRHPKKNLPGRRQSAGYAFVAPGCRLEFFSEKQCRGEKLVFLPGYPDSFAGRAHSHWGDFGWNDRVLSVMCRC